MASLKSNKVSFKYEKTTYPYGYRDKWFLILLSVRFR